MPPQNHERAPLLGGDSHQSYNQNQNNPFKFSAKELGDLIDPKNPDKLREYGDVDGVLSALKTDVKRGISKDENLSTHANGEGESSPFESRINIFGKNVSLLFIMSVSNIYLSDILGYA
jgi:Ca2+-transporting ATPase